MIAPLATVDRVVWGLYATWLTSQGDWRGQPLMNALRIEEVQTIAPDMEMWQPWFRACLKIHNAGPVSPQEQARRHLREFVRGPDLDLGKQIRSEVSTALLNIRQRKIGEGD